MTNRPDTQAVEASIAAQTAPPREDWGWYLYGITHAERQIAVDTADDTLPDGNDGETAEVVVQGGVRAVVRRVPLAEFTPEALRGHADDPAWLETTARQHNSMIEVVHRERTILPAKFGCVYAALDDLRAALREEHDHLLAQLARIEGCDEWGVRLYGNPVTIRQQAAAENAGVQTLRHELASAPPGRAYLLRQKLAGELAAVSDRALYMLIEQAYGYLAQHAVTGQLTKRADASRLETREGDIEIVRAAFLVHRERTDAFLDDVRSLVMGETDLSCEYSGPWPPYSFAARMEEESP